MKYKFNLNDYIKVKIHPEGFEYWKKQDDDFYHAHNLQQYIKPLADYKSKADADGYVKFQAWDFIDKFAASLDFGRKTVFHTDIIISDVHLKSIEEPTAQGSVATKA